MPFYSLTDHRGLKLAWADRTKAVAHARYLAEEGHAVVLRDGAGNEVPLSPAPEAPEP